MLNKTCTKASVQGKGKKGWVYLSTPVPLDNVKRYRFKVLESPNMQIQIGVTLCQERSTEKGRKLKWKKYWAYSLFSGNI